MMLFLETVGLNDKNKPNVLPLKPAENKNLGKQNAKIPGYHLHENQQIGKYRTIKWIKESRPSINCIQLKQFDTLLSLFISSHSNFNSSKRYHP